MDEEGTRCEQRISEGYFPLGESLVRPTEGGTDRLSWDEARALCQADGGDLLTVDDSEVQRAALGGTVRYRGPHWEGQSDTENGTGSDSQVLGATDWYWVTGSVGATISFLLCFR